MRMIVWVDLGFVGIDKRVDTGELFIPFKASKNDPLDKIEKEYNKIKCQGESRTRNSQPENVFLVENKKPAA